MILQNADGDNKIFIDDNLDDFITIHNGDTNSKEICLNNYYYEIECTQEKLTLVYVKEIHFLTDENKLYFYNDEGICICTKILELDEIISFSLGEKNNQFQIVNLTTMKLPKFFFENNNDEKYPKFEINISDCIYSMRIYTDEYTYLDIPDFQSHNSISETLNHISNLIFYLTHGRPDFLNKLGNHDNMDVFIYDKNHDKAIAGGNMKYKLGDNGLYLTGGELENYLVEWQKFFKLVMDQTWEVNFDE